MLIHAGELSITMTMFTLLETVSQNTLKLRNVFQKYYLKSLKK